MKTARLEEWRGGCALVWGWLSVLPVRRAHEDQDVAFALPSDKEPTTRRQSQAGRQRPPHIDECMDLPPASYPRLEPHQSDRGTSASLVQRDPKSTRLTSTHT